MSPKFMLATMFAGAMMMTSAAALAAATDYAFEAVQAEMKKGDDVTVAVRLVHKPTGMAEMESPVTPVSANEPGVYTFKTDLPMAGRYLFSLAAKVQGEPETV